MVRVGVVDEERDGGRVGKAKWGMGGGEKKR